MMVAVAIISINFAALRALIASPFPYLTVNAMESLILLQIGIYRVFSDCGRRRIYWLGFVGGSSVALVSILALISSPGSPPLLATPFVVYLKLVWEPIEGIRNALFQRATMRIHRITGTFELWLVWPAFVSLTSWLWGTAALKVHQRLTLRLR